MTNLFPGLARGPIDHEASSIINAIASESIDMGNVVVQIAAAANEILPRVENADAATEIGYGIVVGGDTDGIYGTGAASTDDTTRASNAAGQAVVVVTQGRCLARITEATTLGAALSPAADGTLVLADTVAHFIIARALQVGVSGDIIAVDVQREGQHGVA
jgi:hypothetical protein